MADKAKAVSLSGQVVMVEETTTAVIVMDTPTPSGHCQFPAPLRMVSFRGTARPAAAPWPPLIAPVAAERER